jgi:hypothetical protein
VVVVTRIRIESDDGRYGTAIRIPKYYIRADVLDLAAIDQLQDALPLVGGQLEEPLGVRQRQLPGRDVLLE